MTTVCTPRKTSRVTDRDYIYLVELWAYPEKMNESNCTPHIRDGILNLGTIHLVQFSPMVLNNRVQCPGFMQLLLRYVRTFSHSTERHLILFYLIHTSTAIALAACRSTATRNRDTQAIKSIKGTQVPFPFQFFHCISTIVSGRRHHHPKNRRHSDVTGQCWHYNELSAL